MAQIELVTLLELVGTLVDSSDSSSASARFRNYLHKNIDHVGALRAYVNDALSNSGPQFDKALQDLINRVGELLGFTVEYGRYRGVRGQIGFDGLWSSSSGKTLVVESKTTDVYTVKTATLLGYINDLVSEERIPSPNDALGLYVYGRFDAATSQLEKAIIAEGRRERLRVISVDALLNLLELKQEYDLEHETVLDLLLPTPVKVDPLVNLIFEMVAQEKREAVEAQITKAQQVQEEKHEGLESTRSAEYYLLPAAEADDGLPAMDNLHRWLDEGMWGLGKRTGYRKDLQPGDRICFYAVRIGIVAEALVASRSYRLGENGINPAPYPVPFAIDLRDVKWLAEPIELTAEVRSRLSAFQGRDLEKGWAWFVQGTSKLTSDDFNLLTGKTRLGEPTDDADESKSSRISLIQLGENYTGKKVRAVEFQSERFEVGTWKEAMITVIDRLLEQNKTQFEQVAMTVRGRKRPYLSRDPDQLRVHESIGAASLFVETNLSANFIVKLCRTLVAEMGNSPQSLSFETE